MAGRGTDIKINDEVKAIGGLKIIGTERHESRRIDNQLRGRAGRQGDPGESKFFISLEDELMRLFGSDRVARVIDALGIDENDPIEHKMLTKAIENAQKKVEANNFGVRKRLLEYDRVMNEQREIIYDERRQVLLGADISGNVMNMLKSVIERTVETYVGDSDFAENWDFLGLNETLMPMLNIPRIEITEEELIERIYKTAAEIYKAKEAEIEPERMREIERVVLLKVIDQKWMDHLDDMDQMRQGISLRAYAQRDPITEYKFISYDMFEELSANIQTETVRGLFNVRIADPNVERKTVVNVQTVTTNKDSESVSTPKKRKEPKVGRNDLCPCGSGKKYKQCCGIDE